jgi:hypothetical protein
MKVLHYAVFNDQKGDFEAASIAYFDERESSLEDVPSKLSSTVAVFDLARSLERKSTTRNVFPLGA